MSYLAELRKFLMQYLSGDELETLCFDYFPELKNDFTTGMKKSSMVIALIEYCERHGSTDQLLIILHKERAKPFEEWFGTSSVKPRSESGEPNQKSLSATENDPASSGDGGDLKAKITPDSGVGNGELTFSNTVSPIPDFEPDAGSEIAGEHLAPSGLIQAQASSESRIDQQHSNRSDSHCTLSEIFESNGPINELLGDSFKVREGQKMMALAIQDAIMKNGSLLIEAGTGIGKTLAYLIPLVLSGKSAIISTANKALQDQLWEKDLPLVEKIINKPLNAAIVKGRANYVCLNKCIKHYDNLYKKDDLAKDDLALIPLPFEEFYTRVAQDKSGVATIPLMNLLTKIRSFKSGDADLLRLSDEDRSQFTAKPNCLAPHGAEPVECFYRNAIDRADKAHIVITNHASLAHFIASGWRTMAKKEVIIIDEAHSLENYIINVLRRDLTIGDIPNLIKMTGENEKQVTNYLQSLRRRRFNIEVKIADSELEKVGNLNLRLFNDFATNNDDNLYTWPFGEEARETVLLIALSLIGIKRQLKTQYHHFSSNNVPAQKPIRDGYKVLLEAYDRIIDLLNDLINESDPGVKYFELSDPSSLKPNNQNIGLPNNQYRALDGSDGLSSDHQMASYAAIVYEPFDAGSFLSTSLWESFSSIIAVSSTLTVNDRFGYMRTRLGAMEESISELVFQSPFDYQHQALLYTPYGIFPSYDENEPQYVEALALEIGRLIQASRGRALVLCTSWKRARQLYYMINPRVSFDVFCQGQTSPREIIERFIKTEKGGVLFATRSFWEGIDIPGKALTMLVIDKIPFQSHDDVLVSQRCDMMRTQGHNPFMDYLLPEAVITLRQGVGRLIRNENDRGVIAILDSRINKANYAKRIIGSLPPATRTFDIEEVKLFLQNKGSE